MPRIGVMGGSGLYQIEGLNTIREEKIDTPFGPPSDKLTIGKLEGQEVVFLPRHGQGHVFMPTEVNNRANIYAMKRLNVQWIISVSAVGSLREDYKPTDAVIIDQFFDRTNQSRPNTFFGNGIVAHIQFAYPLCDELRKILIQAGRDARVSIKEKGTYVNIEGPQFSTLAESEIYRKWGMDVVGMTQISEARLAREAEICYATISMVTDFDCWHEAETGETVSVEMILEYMKENTKTAKEIIKRAIPKIKQQRKCSCADALAGTFVTDKKQWPKETINKLEPIIKKYIK